MMLCYDCLISVFFLREFINFYAFQITYEAEGFKSDLSP